MNENQPHRWIWTEDSPLLVGSVSIHQLLPLEFSSLSPSVFQAQLFTLPMIQMLFGSVLPLPHKLLKELGLCLAAGQSQPSPSALL